jgi:hypothetical protein
VWDVEARVKSAKVSITVMNLPIIRVRNTRRRNCQSQRNEHSKNLLISKCLLRDKDSQSHGYLSFSNLIDEREKSYEHFSLVRVYLFRKRSYKSPNIWSWILQIFAVYYYNTTILLLLPHQLYLPIFTNNVAFIGRLQQPIIEMLKLEI